GVLKRISRSLRTASQNQAMSVVDRRSSSSSKEIPCPFMNDLRLLAAMRSGGGRQTTGPPKSKGRSGVFVGAGEDIHFDGTAATELLTMPTFRRQNQEEMEKAKDLLESAPAELGFVKSLFFGRLKLDKVMPYPLQDPAEKTRT